MSLNKQLYRTLIQTLLALLQYFWGICFPFSIVSFEILKVNTRKQELGSDIGTLLKGGAYIKVGKNGHVSYNNTGIVYKKKRSSGFLDEEFPICLEVSGSTSYPSSRHNEPGVGTKFECYLSKKEAYRFAEMLISEANKMSDKE